MARRSTTSTARRRGRGNNVPASPTVDAEQAIKKEQPNLDAAWVPPFRAAFMLLFAIRLVGAMTSIIADCDEVFNYWEPTHLLLYGRGFQTWEYSPEFGLRSYAYVGLHAVLARLSTFMTSADNGKLAVFFAIRCVLAIISAFSEASLYEALVSRVGKRIGLFALIIMGGSTGMMQASAAFLPSTFAMYCVMWAMIFWLDFNWAGTVLVGALGVMLGWPFCGVVFVPLGLYILGQKRGLMTVIVWGIVGTIAVLGVSALVDYHYYKMWLVPVWNIVKYNALGGGGGDGSNLYGVEPASFYFKNMLLNFNIVFPLAFINVAVLVDKYFGGRLTRARTICLLAPFWLWFTLMTLREHKEERFLFVVYPVLAVCAAMSMSCVYRVCLSLAPSSRSVRRVLCYGTLALAALVSTSRYVSLVSNYAAPLQAFAHLSTVEIPSLGESHSPVKVCIGKEWYRFPSNFFLPDTPLTELAFLKSSFGGQLPQPFAASDPTSVIQPGFNDLNQEEESRYVALEECDYIVDLDLVGQVEPHYGQLPEFEVIWTAPFLDASKSPGVSRYLYIPPLTHMNVYGDYQILRRVRSG